MFSRFNKGLMIVMVLIALSAVIYAFAASGTITPAITASYMTKDVTEYTVSAKEITSVGANVTKIKLTITGASIPTSVALSTTAVGSTDYTKWTCPTIAVAGSDWTVDCTPTTTTTVLSIEQIETVIHN